MKREWAAAIWLMAATPAFAVPPPPPSQADLSAIQTFIRGLSADTPGYADAFTDDLEVVQDGRMLAPSKSAWLDIHKQALRGADHSVRSEVVRYGADYVVGGPDAPKRAMIEERVERVLGDCCVLYRTETLTLRGGRIARIERSQEFDMQLRPHGHRQDEP